MQNLGGDALLGGGKYGVIDVLRPDVWIANFQEQLLLTPEAFGADLVDSIAPVHRFPMQWHSPINPSV